MSSFIENVNYVAGLDNLYGSEIELYKNNLSLKSVQHDIELKFSYYSNDDKKIHSIVHSEQGVLVGGINDTLLSFKTLVESSITGSEFTCVVNFVINNIVMVNISIVSNNDMYKAYELEMKIVTAGAVTYDLFGEVSDTLKILPSLARLTSSDIDAMTNVYEIQDEVITVSDNVTSVRTVSGSIANVNTVGNNIGSVGTVSTNIANVNITATDIASVNNVSSSIVDVNTVSDGIANVNIVSSSITNVDTIATNITVLNSIASNLTEILSADDNAAIATAKALEASNSAATALVFKNAASVSADNALISANNADASEANALASAVSANDSAQSALASKDSANLSAVSANDSAQSALASKDSANLSAVSANDSKSIATTKASEASTSATTATTKALEANNSSISSATSAAEALDSANSADLSESNALAHKNSALASSQSASDSEVSASISAASALASANSATNSASIATTKASEAVASSGSAETSATNALASETKSRKWAIEAEDVPVEPGEYSAKHWASKASKIVSAGLIDDVTPSTSTVFSSTRSNNTYEPKNSNIQGHISNNTTNPHNVTKSQVGLSNVDNTSDMDKPVSTATSTALNSKQATLVSGTNIKTINGATLLGSGDLSTIQTTITGNSGTATKLQTARTINGVAFDGTANITVSDNTKLTKTDPVITGSITEQVYNLTGTAINPANGTIQYKTVSANTTFTETLTSGQSVLLRLIGASSYTITFPTITWVGAVAPTLTANCAIALWKEQSTLYGSFVGTLV